MTIVAVLSIFLLAGSLLAGGRSPQRTKAPAGADKASSPNPSKIGNKDYVSVDDSDFEPPLFWAENADPHAYSLFANGGWDGNWFVGYGTCWITKVPAPPRGRYVKAYIGAKLGRMKTEAIPGRPSWERKPIAGNIDISISDQPLWPESRRYLLTRTDRIPLEGEPSDAVEGVGEAQWFWVEVPLNTVSFEKDNHIVLFSPSADLKDARTSPIVAAAPGDKRLNTWIYSNAQGGPPLNSAEALKTAVSFFDPAIALKLVADNAEEVEVSLLDARPAFILDDRAVLTARVEGSHIQNAWLELWTGKETWRAIGPQVKGAPYTFTLKKDWFPVGVSRVRVGAANIWQKAGYSSAVSVTVKPPAAPKTTK
jgi:hypothetical protein